MDLFSLSHPQRRTWYMENEHPDSAVNNIAFYVTCDRVNDPGVVEEAINRCLQDNDALRIQLHKSTEDEFGILQHIESHTQVSVEKRSFETMEAAELWMRTDSAVPFSLFNAPLYSFCIISTGDSELGYYFKLHHLVTDGATCLSMVYQVEQHCNAKPMNNSFVSYKEFVLEEKKYKKSEPFLTDKDFWMNELASFPEKVSFPPAKSYANTQKSKDITIPFLPELRAQIHDFAKTHKLSVYKILLSALGIYISRVCRVDNFGIGIANHNRVDKRFQVMAGMFVSSLPFLYKIDPQQTFQDYTLQTGAKLNTILKKHARYPFDQLSGDMHREHGEDVSHLLNINLAGHPDMTGFPDMKNMAAGEPYSDLSIHINPNNRDKDGVLELLFSPGNNLCDQDTEIIFQGLSAILEHGLAKPMDAIATLPLVSPAQQRTVFELNDPFVPYPDNVTLVDLFREQVKTRGNSVALSCEGVELSYEELDHWSDRIARALQQSHLDKTGEEVKLGSFIGLSMERGMEMVAAIWGILKVGGAYVPLDPAYPEERLKFIIEDADINQVLIHEKFSSLFQQTIAVHIDDLPPSLPDEELVSETFDSRCRPTDFAYVIYTSGTTGTPKGVPIQHHQVVNLAHGFCHSLHISKESRVLQFSSLNFDASVVDLFPVVVAGGALSVALDKHRTDGEALCSLLEEEKITNTFIPPALLAVMPKKELPHLHCLFVGGESTDPAAIDFWSKNRYMVNGYGPTENTVVATTGPFQEHSLSNDIGTPCQNVSCYVLDQQLQLAPIGIPGELYIGGVQVSSGYINRPELNEKCFIGNPYATEEGSEEWNSRLYKSGDLVRWLDNGHLEFIGRIDSQVKIRGFRIECGEVSIIIGDIPGVASCLVIPLVSGATQRLVAYVIMDTNAAISSDTLRQKATQVLPAYMVPSAFVELESFPMTPNGKIDRRKLPEPKTDDPFEATYVAPCTEIERVLCGIWADVLSLDRVGINDDFFNLGGNSLLCMSMISQANEHGISLQVATLRKFTTIAELDAHLRENNQSEQFAIPPVEKLNSTEPVSLPLTAQLLYQQTSTMEKAGTAMVPAVSTWQLSGPMNPQALLQAIDEITLAHQALRVHVTEQSDELLFSLSDDPDPCRLIPVAKDEIASHIETWRKSHSNDLEPLCAFRLFQLSKEHHVLAFLADHLVLDAWAMKVLCEELAERYNAICETREPNIEKNPFQLFDFSTWYNHLVVDASMEESKQFWKENLEGAKPVFENPPQPDSSLEHFSAIQVFLPLPLDLQADFHDLCKKEKCTPFEGFFTVYNQLLAQKTDRFDILSATVTALRDRPELQNLIGCLTNRLYVRTSIDRYGSFSEALKETGPALTAAREHGLWPVWHEVDPQGQGAPQMFFHYIPQIDSAIPRFNGLGVEPDPLQPPTFWPLPMVVQVLDDPKRPGLICLGHAGFIDSAYAEGTLQDYIDLLRGACS